MSKSKSTETPRYIAVPTSGAAAPLYTAIKMAAGNKAIGSYVQSILATFFNVVIPTTPRAARRKYASEAERKAAVTKARQDKAALVKKLLAQYAAEQAAAERKAAKAA